MFLASGDLPGPMECITKYTHKETIAAKGSHESGEDDSAISSVILCRLSCGKKLQSGLLCAMVKRIQITYMVTNIVKKINDTAMPARPKSSKGRRPILSTKPVAVMEVASKRSPPSPIVPYIAVNSVVPAVMKINVEYRSACEEKPFCPLLMLEKQTAVQEFCDRMILMFSVGIVELGKDRARTNQGSNRYRSIF